MSLETKEFHPQDANAEGFVAVNAFHTALRAGGDEHSAA